MKTASITLFLLVLFATFAVDCCWGSQSRARDSWRVAISRMASESLATFRSSYGEFPTATGTWGAHDTGMKNCLSNSGWQVPSELAKFFKWRRVPLDPQSANLSGNCDISGTFGYFPLEKDGKPRTSFIISTNVEVEKKANYDYCDENGNLKPGWSGLGDGSPRTRFDDWISSESYGTGQVFPSEKQGMEGRCSQYVVIGGDK